MPQPGSLVLKVGRRRVACRSIEEASLALVVEDAAIAAPGTLVAEAGLLALEGRGQAY